MILPADRLLPVLEERIACKQELLAERDRRYGCDRIKIFSYMENIGWPPLFGFDMNRFYSDAAFLVEMELRQRIFWMDNSAGDDLANLQIAPTTGFYWDITLFGQKVRTTAEGVPEFEPHPLSARPDINLLGSFDFRTSGDMPILLRQHTEMQKLNRERYGGKLAIAFPRFLRGPLELAIQLRGYENFIGDIMEAPDFAHSLFDFLVCERNRWNRERAAYLGENHPGASTFIADDWLNPPFISPAIFDEYALPAFLKIQENEGPVIGFHTCGPMAPFVRQMLAAFPKMEWLDVSGWNDFEELDRLVDPKIRFLLQMKNTFVLCASVAEHRALLEKIRRLAERRPVSICAQAIVKLHESYEEDLGRMNRFLELARDIFSSPS